MRKVTSAWLSLQLSHQLAFTNVKSLFFISREPFENYTGQFFSESLLNCDLTALFIDHPYALPSVFSFRVHVHNLDLYIRKKGCSWRAGGQENNVFSPTLVKSFRGLSMYGTLGITRCYPCHGMMSALPGWAVLCQLQNLLPGLWSHILLLILADCLNKSCLGSP